MTQDIMLYTVGAAGSVACAIGFAYGVAYLRALDRLRALRAELAHANSWRDYWRETTERLVAQKQAEQRKRSAAGKIARRCQIEQQRARVAATTSALREVA